MCDFGYLAVCVEDYFLGTLPTHVRRLANALGVRPHQIEPKGPLEKLTRGAHFVASFYTGMCACDWDEAQRTALLELARQIAGASDVAWVKAGFWCIRGASEEGSPHHSLVPRGWADLHAVEVKRDWLVELVAPSSASTPLRYIPQA